jgi:gliding motility associated protien GldN
MKKSLIRLCLFAFFFVAISNVAEAQKGKKRSSTKRGNTTVRKNTKGKTKATVSPSATVDSVAAVAKAPEPAVVIDSLPIPKVKKSLRPDEAVETKDIRDRTPLAYEHLRVDDAVYRHKIWREIDAREKINLPFRYSADENNGNQRFISILMKAIQDGDVTAFSNLDDRFTTPLTLSEVTKVVTGGSITIDLYDTAGNVIGQKTVQNEVNLDSFYKFQIKEEVIFDKEASRLFWRILGIAPVKRLTTSTGIQIGDQAYPLFWVYYPDLRPIFAKYEVYNGKNFGARMTWEELFENRMFSGRIIKSTIDNPFDLPIAQQGGMKENTIFQLLEGERIKEKIFNYELDLWSY